MRISSAASRVFMILSAGAAVLALVCTVMLWADDNVLGLPVQGMAHQGTLFIVGGGHPPESVYDTFVRLAGGKSARLVLIPSGHTWKSSADIERRFGGWHQMHVASFQFLNATSRDEANSDKIVASLSSATGVWIAGGSQMRLASIYDGTKVERAIRSVFDRGGVVAGTSAGASVLSRLMIGYGSPSQAVTGRGLGLLDSTVVDQHFTQRGRYPRLLGVLEQHPDLVGLGIDEATAAIVQGQQLQVIGNSQVTLCIPSARQHATMVYRFKSSQRANVGALRKSLLGSNLK